MKISVVIPTRNRTNTLLEVLSGLQQQSFPQDSYEVIVVDDGSKDNTLQLLKNIQPQLNYKLRIFSQPHKGPAAARNLGINHATGEIILFLGDDIIPDKTLLEEHYKIHSITPQNVSVLGLVVWDKRIKKNFLTEYLDAGVQFSYYKLVGKKEVDFNCFWTANVSVKRSFLLKNGLFDERFRYPAHEDTELGYRLIQKGMKILFNENAIGYHCHKVTLREYCKKHIYIGRSIVLFHRKYPELPLHPDIKEAKKIFYWQWIKRPIAYFLLPIGFIFRIKWLVFSCYSIILNCYKLKGIVEELKKGSV